MLMSGRLYFTENTTTLDSAVGSLDRRSRPPNGSMLPMLPRRTLTPMGKVVKKMRRNGVHVFSFLGETLSLWVPWFAEVVSRDMQQAGSSTPQPVPAVLCAALDPN
jgi:hypothetical protein